MTDELKEAITDLTEHINTMRVLKNYWESDATSYEKEKEKVIKLKQINNRVKELLL